MDKQVETTDITRPNEERLASGKPGEKPSWSSGAKTIVGTSSSSRSHVWFTVGLGTLNEIYFADVEQANTKSLRFLVSNGQDFFSDEARDAEHTVTNEAGIPCCRIESNCRAGRYRIVKEIISDPVHDTVVVRVKFIPRTGENLQLYLMADPHIGDKGEENDGWVGRYKGRDMLFAQRGSVALAVAFTVPVQRCMCGYVGKSDALTLLAGFKELTNSTVAECGNVSMTAELDYRAMNGDPFVFAVGFGTSAPEAAQEASAGMLQNFDKLRDHFVSDWRATQSKYTEIKDLSGAPLDMYRVSTAVLETHQSKRFPGGFIASLSLPWGFDRSDKDIGGYHVLWPRDMVETAMGKLASGDAQAARSTLFFLRCTQQEDGGWSQNMFLDGTPHWSAVQMDGTALPILLVDQLRREEALDGYDATSMIETAVRFLLKYGPYTGQDRWEELPGYSPYTTATEVAALLAAAGFCDSSGDSVGAEFLRQTADAWHDTVDEFTYVTGTDLAETHGVSGYYIRIAPPERVEQGGIGHLQVKMGNQPFGEKHHPAANIVSPDALALVRFGLRAADDPRIVNTVKVVDATLRRRTKTGDVWIRSSKDGYGETDDGAPYKKHGVGRGWPLLAGERAHYELAAGNREGALILLKTMARQTSECGMIPEQVWDADDIPEKMLFNGRPAGSGMPLVWAHAEYIKLLRSLHAGAIWDIPPQTVQRYQVEKRSATFQIWTISQKRGWLAADKDLRIDLPAAAILSWRTENASGDLKAQDSGFGIHYAYLTRAMMGQTDRLSVRISPQEDSKESELKAQSFVVNLSKASL